MANVTELFNHIPVGIVTSGGTTTSDTAWTVTVTSAFPATSGTAQFHVCDPASTAELILVTSCPGGTGAGQSWTVARGAQGTTAVSHTANFTIYQVTPAGFLNAPVFNGAVKTLNSTLDDGSGNATLATSLTTGGFSTGAVHVTTNYTALASDMLITGDPTAGSIIVTVPVAAAGNKGRMIAVVQTTTGGGNIIFIEDTNSTVLGSTFHQFECNIIQSDGTAWYVVSNPVTTGSQTWNGQKQFAGGINVTAGIQLEESTQTANYALSNNNDTIVLMNGTSLTATLPQALFVGGEIHCIKNLASSALTVATTSSQTIDGVTSMSLSQNQCIVVVSDGSNWQVLAGDGIVTGNLNVTGTITSGSGGYLPEAGGTMTGQLTLAAGTTSLAPVTFQSGTLNTTATAGVEEYDGTCFYATAAGSSRQVIDAEQFQVLSGSYTLANNTNAQPLFNATVNGALAVQGSTSYWFECEFDGTGFSSSLHSIQFGFALTNSASVTSIKYLADSNLGAAGTFAAWNSAIITSASATTLHAGTTTNTTFNGRLRGIIRMNHAGTITPQITQASASAAAVISANSWFRIWPCGSGTVTNVGDWS